MYTIYVNDCPLHLVSSLHPVTGDFTLRYNGKPKFFLQATGTLEGGGHPNGMTVICPDVNQAWVDFLRHYALVEAAGGVVHSPQGVLCIHRRGSWDLPKGKIDLGESHEEAAVREVQEETGVQQLTLGKQLPTSYHTYYTKKGKRVLKPTYWFEMQTDELELTPQAEEDIDEARWIAPDALEPIAAAMYPSLLPVLFASVRPGSAKPQSRP